MGNELTDIPDITFVDKDGNMKKFSSGRPAGIDGMQFMSLKLTESLNDMLVFGEIIFRDYGKVRKAHMFAKGYDYVLIRAKGKKFDGGEYVLKMEVLNITGREDGKLYEGGYDIVRVVLAQYPAYKNLLAWNISKGYSDITISDIAEDIFDTYLNYDSSSKDGFNGFKSIIEKTDEKIDSFYIPNWSIADTLNYLANIAFTCKGKDKVAGFYTFFDIENNFNFRSLEDIITSNKETETIFMKDILSTETTEEETDTDNVIRDYFPDIGHKEYYRTGLSGASIETFNFFKKKNYVYRVGYKNRPLRNELPKLYEKEEYINNMYGHHNVAGMPMKNGKEFADAMALNQLMRAVSAQCSTQIATYGIRGLKVGKLVEIKKKVKDTNENVMELVGRWFIRRIAHTWSGENLAYTQLVGLGRVGKFEH